MTIPKKHLTTSWLGAAALGLLLSACGSANTDSKASGQGLTETTSAGTIALNDSSAVVQSRTAPVEADGSFSLDMSGLEAPFVLRLEWTEAEAVHRFYGVSEGRENLDVNALTDLAFRSSHGSDDLDESDDDAEDDDAFEHSDHDRKHGSATQARKLLAELTVVLAPLFERYGITDPRTDRDAVRLLLLDVKITLDHRTVTVTNRATGLVIFTGRLSHLSDGVFTAANMPAGPGGVVTCTEFTYAEFGACQADNTQVRTVLTSSPAGCTGGAPVLSQACTYVPPVNACTSFTYSAFGACQADNTQVRTVLTSSPAGCTGGSPILSQACTYVPPVNTCTSFTYSAFAACMPDNTQVRTVLTSSPAGCTGGAPVLTQACTYVPPIDGAALYTQYCAGCHGNGKKGSSASSIQTAINNNVGGMGSASLRALTAAQVAAIAAAP